MQNNPNYPQGQPISPPPPYQQPPWQPPPIPPPKRKRRVWLWIIGTIVVFAVIGTALGNQGGSQTSTAPAAPQAPSAPVPTDTPTPTLAYELAALDAGGNLPANDPSVATYQTLLDSLHNKTGDSEQTIADETVRGQQLLHDKGKDVTLLDLLKGVNTAISSKSEHIHYAEALAALITIMEGNQ